MVLKGRFIGGDVKFNMKINKKNYIIINDTLFFT